ncbi:MAG: glycosyltransferase family 4 protein, partial [Alphaproteobacteria bacterium]|nr:glycosyltransferase family 4 protein [Alphaproteobacteria bacterium]
MAQNILIGVFSFVVTCCAYLLVQTTSPLSDVFTAGRISILKDRPANITRDIIVDMSVLCEKGGILTLTQDLISDISKKRLNWRLLVLVPRSQKRMCDLPESNNIKLIEIDNSVNPFIFAERILNPECFGMFHDKLTQLLYYDQIFCDRDCDLVWDPVGDSCCCNFVNVPRISTIHDLACFDVYPEFFATKGHRLRAYICTEKAIHFSKKIITVSEFSQKRIYDHFHVSKDFVKHIPIQLGTRVYSQGSPEKSAKILSKYNLKPQKYFIFCSSWWKNKNHLNLMNAFNKFAQKNSDIKLILVGKHPDTFKSRPIQKFSSDRVIITGFVPDEELGILLKNALAFIHPSVYEGFGMPIIEAMANGIPVACSNVASLPEVAGSAALFFDPFDTDSITQAMHRLAADPQLRKDLIQKGYEQAK